MVCRLIKPALGTWRQEDHVKVNIFNYTGSPQAILDLGELVRGGTQVLRLGRKQLLSYFLFFKTRCLCVAALAILELAV